MVPAYCSFVGRWAYCALFGVPAAVMPDAVSACIAEGDLGSRVVSHVRAFMGCVSGSQLVAQVHGLSCVAMGWAWALWVGPGPNTIGPLLLYQGALGPWAQRAQIWGPKFSGPNLGPKFGTPNLGSQIWGPKFGL